MTVNFTKELNKQYHILAWEILTKSCNFHKSYFQDKFMTNKKVWIRVDQVRGPLEACYWGLYKVLIFLIETSDNINTKVSVDRLKSSIELIKQKQYLTMRTDNPVQRNA